MKLLKEHLSLDGEVEVIDATDFRAHIGEALTQAQLGKCFCIKRKGEVMAFLVPATLAGLTHVIESDGSCETLGLTANTEKGIALNAIVKQLRGSLGREPKDDKVQRAYDRFVAHREKELKELPNA